MTKLERLFPTFGAAFAVIYAVVLDFNLAAVTYVPKLGEWHVGVFQPAPGDGPPMYWYGLVLTSLIVAIVVTAAAAHIPPSVSSRTWNGLTWLLPVGSMLFLVWLLLPYYTK
jgi:hypothetical protein